MQPNTPDLHPHFGGEKGKVLADTPRDGMAASVSPTNRPMRWREEAGYVLKTARPGFWLTQIWFFLLPLAQVPLLDSPRFWLGIVYISFGLGFVLYGWNDLVDAETDRLNPRKDSFLFGARGTAAQLARLPWLIALVQLPFMIVWRERAYTAMQMRVFFVGWNAVALGSIGWIWQTAALTVPRYLAVWSLEFWVWSSESQKIGRDPIRSREGAEPRRKSICFAFFAASRETV